MSPTGGGGLVRVGSGVGPSPRSFGVERGPDPTVLIFTVQYRSSGCRFTSLGSVPPQPMTLVDSSRRYGPSE